MTDWQHVRYDASPEKGVSTYRDNPYGDAKHWTYMLELTCACGATSGHAMSNMYRVFECSTCGRLYRVRAEFEMEMHE